MLTVLVMSDIDGMGMSTMVNGPKSDDVGGVVRKRKVGAVVDEDRVIEVVSDPH